MLRKENRAIHWKLSHNMLQMTMMMASACVRNAVMVRVVSQCQFLGWRLLRIVNVPVHLAESWRTSFTHDLDSETIVTVVDKDGFGTITDNRRDL